MRRSFASICAAVLLFLTACAGENTGGRSAVPPTAGPETLFSARAEQVAEGWRAAPAAERWRTGFVPLQDLTVLVGEPSMTDETKQAFMAGWFRNAARFDPGAPGRGAVTFPGGQKMDVPLVSAATAYSALAHGDPPPCAGRTIDPPVPGQAAPDTTTGPDGSVSHTPRQACTALTVTGYRLGTVPLRTSRGQATVPAYLFTVNELDTPVARVAVDPSAITEPQVAIMPSLPPATSWLRSAQGLRRVNGTTLEYRLGLGACDVDVKPLFAEYDDVVVVGGTARVQGDVCTDQLVLKPVAVTLAKPLGDRVVLDATTGQPQSLTATGG